MAFIPKFVWSPKIGDSIILLRKVSVCNGDFEPGTELVYTGVNSQPKVGHKSYKFEDPESLETLNINIGQLNIDFRLSTTAD